jgi:NAD(P)H dehydrogenase (quinone)
MNVFIVYCHPEPQSFNRAMLQTACKTVVEAGHEVLTSDLYEMCFDPVSDRRNFTTTKDTGYFKQQVEELYANQNNGFAQVIEEEINKIEWCDLMIWQFPLWWFGLPAVLKGWVDRVFVMGRTYGSGQSYEQGIFCKKQALLSVTTGGSADSFDQEGKHGDIAGILRPIHRGILRFVGFNVLAPQIVYGPARLTDEQRKQKMSEFAKRLQRISDELPIDVGTY